jgi:plasmid stabilization system protein ParE
MTRFTVVWLERASNQLTRIWLDTENRDAVNRATALIDAELLHDAENKGEEFAPGSRTLTVHPLRVLFAVRELDRIVEVARVRLLK